jgi:hypothetical protein
MVSLFRKSNTGLQSASGFLGWKIAEVVALWFSLNKSIWWYEQTCARLEGSGVVLSVISKFLAQAPESMRNSLKLDDALTKSLLHQGNHRKPLSETDLSCVSWEDRRWGGGGGSGGGWMQGSATSLPSPSKLVTEEEIADSGPHIRWYEVVADSQRK